MDATTRRVPGGLPGQSDDWRSWNCRTTGLNDARDMIGVSLADEWMGLYLRSSEYQDTPRRAQRMLEAARWIKDQADRLQAIAETLDTVPGQMADR